MALISMAEWLDRHGQGVEDDVDAAGDVAPEGAGTAVHFVPTAAVRWRRHHEPLHATLRPRLHRRALRLARLRRARPAAARS